LFVLVFAESLRQSERIRTLEELKHIIGGSYQKCPPQVFEIWDTMDFDEVVKDIGSGTTAGIQGSHNAPQEEKPHQFKIALEDGRAQLWWKPLSTSKVWTKLEKSPLVADAYFPAMVPTVQRKPVDPRHVNDLSIVAEKLKETYGEDYANSYGEDTILDSWNYVIDKYTNPEKKTKPVNYVGRISLCYGSPVASSRRRSYM
jgi:hypothetical protein